MCRFWSRQTVLASAHFAAAQCAVAGKRRNTIVHLQKKSVIKYDLTAAPCFSLAHHNDWSRPFTTNLVVPHLFAIPVSILWLGLQRSEQLNLDVKITLAESHTEHHWRC